ncbi:hypothetical protein AALP_AAs59809U000100 [Arabis alpina]|uniref:Uncharacterized protein n=1 Tax=Arabis alpina TaxID=50452 RepID=A0A087G0A6_ARAAL|nr:hypothetical protein AALP_AAs59809U000100 [Arabis alpina]
MPGLTPNMLSVPYDVSGAGGGNVHLRDSPSSQPVPNGALATSLANAAPEHQQLKSRECFSRWTKPKYFTCLNLLMHLKLKLQRQWMF